MAVAIGTRLNHYRIDPGLSESIRGLIDGKISRLKEEERRLLSAASVQGYEFDSAVIAQALDLDAADVEDQLESLERVHVLVRQVEEREFPDRTGPIPRTASGNEHEPSLDKTRKARGGACSAERYSGFVY